MNTAPEAEFNTSIVRFVQDRPFGSADAVLIIPALPNSADLRPLRVTYVCPKA